MLKPIKNINADERETHIYLDKSENKAQIYTCDVSMITKLNKLMQKSSDYKLVETYGSEESPSGYLIEAPYKCVNLRLPSKISKEIKQKRSDTAKKKSH